MKKTLFLSLMFLYSISNLQAQCWLKLDSKYEYALAIKSDNSLWKWGVRQSTPLLVDSLSNWKEVTTGKGLYAAIKSDGTLWTWGENSYGQLGNGTTTNLWSPSQLGTETNWLKIGCGPDFMLAIKNDGTLWTWGNNRNTAPTQLETDSDWMEISSGKEKSFALKTDWSLWLINSGSTQLKDNGQWKTMSRGTSASSYGIKLDGTL